MRNRYVDFLIVPSFEGVNRLFVLSFKHNDGRGSHKQYYFPTVEIKHYNVTINGRNLFDQPIKVTQKHMTTLERFQQVK